MRNYIYMMLMLIPSIILLMLILVVAGIFQLFCLPTNILEHLNNYDLEQARKHKI